MGVYAKLLAVQSELKAPKGQYNSFGKYKYRSCEDIVEAVKPILAKYKALIMLDDEIVEIAGRFYVKATARFLDCESGDSTGVSAYAREDESKKGMDGAQVTGATSSYARKYALNGLLAIDDTKDADATNTHGKDEPAIPVHMCDRCKLTIEAKKHNGKTYSAECIAENAMKSFGRELCWNCMNELKAERAAGVE